MTDPVMLLSQAHGEGRVTYRALRAAGFFTLVSVAEVQAGILAERAHLSARSARRLKTGAEEMLGQGVSSNHTHAPSRSKARAAAQRVLAKPLFSDGVIAEEAMLLLGDPLRPPAEEAEVVSIEDGCRVTPPLSPEVLEGLAAAGRAAADLARVAPPAILIREPQREAACHNPDPPRGERASWAFG